MNVVGYFALTENMTGGDAMKLGDVLTMRNGTTVEVLNTDAEGRLILADVLSYAVGAQAGLRDRPGHADRGLHGGPGPEDRRPVLQRRFAVAEAVQSASKRTGERAWRLPLDDDFDDAIKSKVADIRNVGGKWGGAITAAKFLQRVRRRNPLGAPRHRRSGLERRGFEHEGCGRHRRIRPDIDRAA